MNAPVRLLCTACLRSVEWSGSDESAVPRICPHCGTPLDPDRSWMADASEDADAPIDSLRLTPPDISGGPSREAIPIVPRTVGRFQLRELIGGGGFGQVYLAYDPRLDREVALKVLKDAMPAARAIERFFREARAAAQLDHPNIVALHDAGRDGPTCWIAYHFIRGRTLNEVLAASDQPRGATWAARVALALARALEHAHGRGVYHRDLKPSNVLIDEDGQPRLTDFGLARRLGVDPTITHDGGVIGTPAYMSPEQAAGLSHLIDQRSDVYSLGLILREMLGGRGRRSTPPSGVPAWRIAQGGVPGAAEPRWPRGLRAIGARALAHAPADRYPTAGAMADDLTRWLDTCRRGWRPPLAVGLALTLGLAAGLLLPSSSPHVPPATAAAAREHEVPIRVNVRPRRGPVSPTGFLRKPGSKLIHRAGCLAVRQDPGAGWAPAADPRSPSGREDEACLLCIDPSPFPPDAR